MIYGTSTIKRYRRTQSEMDKLHEGLIELLYEDHPQTVRGVFYQATVNGLVEKTEAGYRTVQRALSILRERGDLPFGFIADNTRWMRKPQSHSDLDTALNEAYRYYRKSIWEEQCTYVEIWIEKDALAGVVYEVTEEWDVPLMVTRGYSSLSFLYESAGAIAEKNKPTFIYCLGDYDPSGVDISRNVEKRLRQYAPGAKIYFERVAVTTDQIRVWNLPSRPTKSSDSRAKQFNGDSVELDAIPARQLKAIVRDCIQQHVDPDVLKATRLVEQAERNTLKNFIKTWGTR